MSKEAQKRYLIETSVKNTAGSQTWYVDATSEAEALEQYEQGECDLYASNVEVTSLGEPEISGETTLGDFGDFVDTPQPPQRQPLTDGQISWFWSKAHDDTTDRMAFQVFARAIETAHGITSD